jgi:hypothetical protein
MLGSPKFAVLFLAQPQVGCLARRDGLYRNTTWDQSPIVSLKEFKIKVSNLYVNVTVSFARQG